MKLQYTLTLGCSVLAAASAQAQLLNENFDAADGGFVSSSTGPFTQEWVHSVVNGSWQVFGDATGTPVNNYLTTPPIAISTTGGIEIEFDHKYSFEAEWDGGVLQMSIDGGPFQAIPSTSFSANPYTFPSLIGQHDLTGQEAFNGDSMDVDLGSYITSVATSHVGIPAGSTVQLRLTAGFDQLTLGTFSPAWELTRFQVTKQADGDNDGMPDAYESAFGLNPADAGDAGTSADADTLTNLEEYLLGTDPQNADTDGDGLTDDVETGTGTYVDQNDTGTGPLNPDSDGDGLLDGAEDPGLPFVDKDQAGTNPLDVDSDGDGFDDGLEVLTSSSDPTNPVSRPLRSGLLDILAYWDFNDDSVPDQAVDLVKGFVGTFRTPINDPLSPTAYTADGGGRTGLVGDKAVDFGTVASNGTGIVVELGEFLNIAGKQNQIAVSFWQNLNAVNNSVSFRGLSPSSNDGQRGIGVHAPWGNNLIYFDTAGCCGGATQRISGANGVITTGSWRHIVFQKNGDSKEVWVDGTMVVSGTNTLPLPTDFTDLIIGSDNGTLNITGAIDDFVVYADALTPAEITALAGGADPLSLVPSNDDSDSDGIPDAYETANGLNPAVDDSLGDLDNDGANNLAEYLNNTDPNDDDSDNDGLKDGVETNTGIWVSATDTGSDPLNGDSDGDGLSDGLENPDLAFVDASQPGTDPNKADTDEDTYSDSLELDLDSDPTQAGSVPEVGLLELLVYYDFNGQTADQTGNAPDATFAGSAALTTGGMGFSGLPGDESLDLMGPNDGSAGRVAEGSHFARINLNDAASVSFWQYNDIVSSSSAFWLIAPAAGNNLRGMQAHTPWGNGTVYLDVSGNTTDGVGRLTSTGATIAGQWQHFVFQKSATGDLEIWIDGVMVASGVGAPTFVDFNGAFTIGAEGTNLINSFDGRIDEFAVFSNVLDEEQIGLLADGTSPADLFGRQAPLTITDIQYDAGTDRATLTWNSKTNTVYTVEVSPDLELWLEVDDNVNSQGDTTTLTLPPGTGAAKYFYRVFRNN